MIEKNKNVSVVARVEVGIFPGGTLTEWATWRQAQNERMVREAGEQLAAWVELSNGSTRH